MSSSAPDDDALRRQFYGARDIRSLYPRVTENHLRYLEKWGLIRPAAHTITERFYSFTDLSTIKQLVAELDRDQTYSDAMQSRINGLTADFTARDDPAQRAVIARDRQKAMDELDRLKLVIQRTRKAIADLEEEARRASVPPGWLR